MRFPLFSIIITTLNGEKTIQACLSSIAGQTFPDYELVVVDGGSSDKTVEIINNSSIKNKTIRVAPGIGLYAGLNVGIDLAIGQWLYFMGCDDQLYDCDVLMNVWKIIGRKKDSVKILSGCVKYAQQGYVMHPKFGSPYWSGYQIHHQGTFYDSKLFHHVRYDEELHISSDYEINLKFALHRVASQKLEIMVSLYGEKGRSSLMPELGFYEIGKIHRKHFNGLTLYWVECFFALKKSVWFFRNKFMLLNIKQRFFLRS